MPGNRDTVLPLRQRARSADLAVIPVRLYSSTLRHFPLCGNALRVAGILPSCVVLNGIHPSATRSPSQQREAHRQRLRPAATARGSPVAPRRLRGSPGKRQGPTGD